MLISVQLCALLCAIASENTIRLAFIRWKQISGVNSRKTQSSILVGEFPMEIFAKCWARMTPFWSVHPQ